MAPAKPTRTVYQPSSDNYRDIFSVKTFNLPPQVTGRSLQCKAHSRVQYATGIDSNTNPPVIYSGYHKNFQQKEPSCPQCKEAKLPRQDNPTCFGKLSRQLPV